MTDKSPGAESKFAEVRARLWQKRVDLEDEWHILDGHELEHDKWWMPTVSALVTTGLKIAGLYEAGERNAVSPELTRFELAVPTLPGFLDGFTLLHASDFHFSRRDTRLVEKVADMLEGVAVDAVFLTGDYRFGHYGGAEHVPGLVQRAIAGVRSRLGNFAVLGNHDIAEQRDNMAAVGIHMLVNEGLLLDVGAGSFWLGGVDDPHLYRCAHVEAALSGAPGDSFKLLLAHSPEVAVEAAARGVGLYLCGHTHGGQVCLPWWGPVKINSRCAKRLTRGTWTVDAMVGHTTNGLGVTDIPLRFHAPAQASIITLRRARG